MPKPAVLWSHAFRPFFLLSGLAAVTAVCAWILILRGVGMPVPNVLQWHGHEMLVGFAMATIAGFLLTAVATWTGRKPVDGAPLVLLAIFWIAGRFAMAFAAGLQSWEVAALDMLFPVWLCLLVGREIFAAENRRNYPIVAITVLLALLNLVYHFGIAGVIPRADRLVLYFFIHTILLLITVIGGRILPNFTANWMRSHGTPRPPVNSAWLDRLTIGMTILLGVTGSLYETSSAVGWLAITTAILHAWRLSQWRGLATFREPLLFVLHFSYFWLPVGYALLGLAIVAGMGTATGALHVLTMGGIGGMILSMITRVPLGHTGRPLHASRLTVVAYISLIVAVLLRVWGPLDSKHYLGLLTYAGVAWCAAFTIFLIVYWPVLTQARVDQPKSS
ncbi:MAG: NnrS family protein [Gammaproteobacteria bacterium]|nr:NnrS family protein [Gammaproteobacteria bacterium]MDH5215030.1 NnrS family protein [Gammaproteobacteria bacterium]